jgi:hypothetical protein
MLSFIKDGAIIVASLFTVIAFFSGIWEYRRRTRQERAENLLQMRRRFLETPAFREILEALMTQDPRITETSLTDRRSFAGFLEEIALLANSHLMRPEVAHYMFGYYVLLTDDSAPFWEGLDRESVYWSQFRLFAARIRQSNANNKEKLFVKQRVKL